MEKSPEALFEKLWKNYSSINPQAHAIHEALVKRGEAVVNDHIAFRTFSFPETHIEVFARPFLECGYQFHSGGYHFEDKKLNARFLIHPHPDYPKVFISQLEHEKFSKELQRVVTDLVKQIPQKLMKSEDFLTAGGVWKPVSYSVYKTLLSESEYAAWMAAFGLRVNHFTVSFNALKTFRDLHELNTFIRGLGFPLNTVGGEVKGAPKDLLEQSSTLAYPVKVAFSDGEYEIPGCYYEFAKRYPGPDGKLFQGFVPASADKLFESTDVRLQM